MPRHRCPRCESLIWDPPVVSQAVGLLMAMKALPPHDALAMLDLDAAAAKATVVDFAEAVVERHETTARPARSIGSPFNLAMLRIALSQSVVDERAPVVALHSLGTEHQIVSTTTDLRTGASRLRLRLGPAT